MSEEFPKLLGSGESEMNSPSPLAPILQKYPPFIPFPVIVRPHRSASSGFNDIVTANQLPSRFFFGDLVDEAFEKNDDV